MTGVATRCGDNPRLRRAGCGAPYSGDMCHCVARAPWSAHADGICHETFSTQRVADLHHPGGHHVHPAEVLDKRGDRRLHQDARGVWRSGRPESPESLHMRLSDGETTPGR